MNHQKHSKAMLSLAKTFRVPEGTTPSAIQEILTGLDCPRSLAVSIILRDDPSQLKTLGFDPSWYRDMPACRDAYAATKLASKANFLKTGLDLKRVAFNKFSEMEDLCKQTNARFRRLHLDPSFRGPNVWMLNAFTRKIADVLVGYSPEEFFEEANWGPGVTNQIKGCIATATNKFQLETGITRDLHTLIADCMTAAYPHWGPHLNEIGYPKFEVGNKVVTVPKDAFTDRVIAVEPGLNLWFQKAIGSMIRKRLLIHGIDLNHQSINQQYALDASKNGSLATVDFSSASDTVSRELVNECFPAHWLAILDASRSHFGNFEGKLVKWEKFSSMGNGFTFELESLIFYAAAHAVCTYLKLDTSEISVYGDDVIIPSDAFEVYSSFCAFLGFRVNKEKSYHGSTPFRESCGAHYYDGSDIKPIFIKKIARNILELYRQLNAIRRFSHLRLNGLGCDGSLKNAWLVLYKTVPKNLRIFGPESMGDGFILGNFDEAHPVRARNGIEGYYFMQLQEVGKKRRSEDIGLLLDRYRNRSEQEYGNNYTLRNRTQVILNRKTLVQRWCNLGPWYN